MRLTDRQPVRLATRYTVAWCCWIAMFFVIEGSALWHQLAGGTLTWHLRTWLALGSRTKWVGRALAAALLCWLCWHFLYPVPVVDGTPASPQGGSMLTSLLLKFGVGILTTIVVGAVKTAAPSVWNWLPTWARPLASAVLGALASGGGTIAVDLAAGAATTVANVAVAAVVGGAGGASGRAVRDAVREVIPAGPEFMNRGVSEP